jgi:hypothetical protein
MNEPTTAAGRALLALLAEADVLWPDRLTRVAASVFERAIAAIDAEARDAALAEAEAAVTACPAPNGYALAAIAALRAKP